MCLCCCSLPCSQKNKSVKKSHAYLVRKPRILHICETCGTSRCRPGQQVCASPEQWCTGWPFCSAALPCAPAHPEARHLGWSAHPCKQSDIIVLCSHMPAFFGSVRADHFVVLHCYVCLLTLRRDICVSLPILASRKTDQMSLRSAVTCLHSSVV